MSEGAPEPAGGQERYVLHRVDDRSWVILADETRDGSATGTAARITMTDDDEFHVVWLMPTPLPVVYTTPEDALASLVTWQQRPHGGTKPIPIPHFRPHPRGST